MATITLTAAMRANLLSLQKTAGLMDQTQLRLSTGNKVNSALDNPTSYFASQSLTARSSDLAGLLDAMGQSIQVLKSADNGITELTSLVQQAQAIASTAYGAVSNTGGQATSADISAADAANLTTARFAAGQGFTLSSNGVIKGTVIISAGETLNQLVASINALSGVSATVVASSSGATVGSQRIQINSTSGETLTLTDAGAPAGGVTAFGAIVAGNGVAGTTLAGGVAGGPAATGVAIAANGVASDYLARQAQYNTILTQIDQLIADTGYQGTNLLNGDNLKTVFNEKTGALQNSLTVQGVTFDSAGLGLSQADFTTTNSINNNLAQINAALSTLRTQASTFGYNLTVIQARQDFTNNLVNILNEGSSKLVLADKNEESANMLSLQTAQQLGVQALSLASQANQSVLRLFQ